MCSYLQDSYLKRQKVKNALTTRLKSFQVVELQLQEIAETNEDEAKKVMERDDSYIILPLDAEEAILNLIEIGERFHPQPLPEKFNLEELKLRHEQELEKEREGWKPQLTEYELQRTAIRKDEFIAELEK